MRTSMILLAATALGSSAMLAQEKSEVEIGTALGVTLTIPDDGDAELFAGVPGAGTLLGAPSIYATLFPSPSVMLEPQLWFEYNSIGEEVVISPMLQLGHLMTPDTQGSGYVAFNVGGLFRTRSGAANSASLGAGIGYRTRVTSGAAFRVELLYRRWLGESYKLNDLSLRFAFGAVF